MPYMRNAWYCVGYPEDIAAGTLKSITVLGEPLLIFRSGDGAIAALLDRCPHRFAPLSLGQVVGDEVQCRYHGLRFDRSGECTRNPHGDQAIPKAAKVQTYPTLVRHGVIWVWMGDVEKADPAALPDFREIEARPGWTRVSGYLKTPVYYELINDNLLDLTHVRYLHAFLTGVEGERVEPLRMEVRLEQKGETVVSINENFSDGCSPVVHLMWEHGAPPDLIDSRFNMRWDAPALMLLDSGFTRAGGARSDGPSFPSAHLLTPETETTTHYFWVITRNTHVDRADVSQQVAHAAMAAFGSEDSPMIQACQHNMGTTDLMSLNPVLLQTDAAPMRARRVLRFRLEAKACAA